MITYKATTLDRSSQTEINEFNKLLAAYKELQDPNVEVARDSLLKDFQSMKSIFDKDTTFTMEKK